MNNIKIVFSIPGRMRINIPALLHNEKKSYDITGMLDELCGVISVQPNIRTGNVLVCYDSSLINEKEIWYVIKGVHDEVKSSCDEDKPQTSLYPLIPKKIVQTIIHRETHLSRRFIKAAIFTGGIVFAFKFMLRRFITILIFACPIILFTIPITTFYYGVKRAKNRKILLKDISAIERLERTQSVLINESIFMLGMDQEESRKFIYQNIDWLSLQRLLRIRTVDNLLNLKISHLVFGIRNNGITDIAIITNKESDFVNGVADSLGIDKIYRIQDNVTMLEFFKEHSLIVTSEEIGKVSKNQKALTMYVYNADCVDRNNFDITIHCRDINKVPWLIGLTRYCREIITRSQNSTVAIHSVGILLAALGYIGPFGALSIYGVNMMVQHLYIKNKVLFYEKEIGRGK